MGSLNLADVDSPSAKRLFRASSTSTTDGFQDAHIIPANFWPLILERLMKAIDPSGTINPNGLPNGVWGPESTIGAMTGGSATHRGKHVKAYEDVIFERNDVNDDSDRFLNALTRRTEQQVMAEENRFAASGDTSPEALAEHEETVRQIRLDGKVKMLTFMDYISVHLLHQDILDRYAGVFGEMVTLEFNNAGAQVGTTALKGPTAKAHLEHPDTRAYFAYENVEKHPLFEKIYEIRKNAGGVPRTGDLSLEIMRLIPETSLQRYFEPPNQIRWSDEVKGLVLARNVFAETNGNDPNGDNPDSDRQKFFDIVRSPEYLELERQFTSFVSRADLFPDKTYDAITREEFFERASVALANRTLDRRAAEDLIAIVKQIKTIDPKTFDAIDAQSNGRLSEALVDYDRSVALDLKPDLVLKTVASVFGMATAAIDIYADYRLQQIEDPQNAPATFGEYLQENAAQFAFDAGVGVVAALGVRALFLAGPIGAGAAIAGLSIVGYIGFKDTLQKLRTVAEADWPDSALADGVGWLLDTLNTIEAVLPELFLDALLNVMTVGASTIYQSLAPTLDLAAGEAPAFAGDENAWLVGSDAAALIGSDATNVALHTGYGELYGAGGDDWLLAYGPELKRAGELIGEAPAAGQEDLRREALEDLRARLVGGDGDDAILALGGRRGGDRPDGAVIYGDAGDDWLAAWSGEDTLYGGAGEDVFAVSAGTRIMDAETQDRLFFNVFPVYGGIQQPWVEGPWAMWSPTLAYTTAITNFVPFVTITGSFTPGAAAGVALIDSFASSLFQFAPTEDGGLVVQSFWREDWRVTIDNYSVDFDTGEATAGVVVYRQQPTTGATRDQIEAHWRLASKVAVGSFFGKDPLVLDLDNDGIELTRLSASATYFDLDADGFAERTAWVSGDDGLLARDLDGDGAIGDVSELFGDADTPGLTALAALDANADGRIDAADAAFGELLVWRDADGDGTSRPEELTGLAAAGIASIDLTGGAPAEAEIRGNAIRAESRFTRVDGSTGTVADALLETDEIDTRYLGDAAVSPDAAALPGLRGVGTAPDLRVAMTADAALRGRVEAFAALPETTGWSTLRAEAEAILIAWTNADGIAPDPLGASGIAARQLAAFETLAGAPLAARDATGAPRPSASQALADGWADVVAQTALRLAAQGPWADALSAAAFDLDADRFSAAAPDALARTAEAFLLFTPNDAAAAEALWRSDYGPALAALAQTMKRADGVSVRDDFLIQSLVLASDRAAPPVPLAALLEGAGVEGARLGGDGADALARLDGGPWLQTFVGGAGDDTLTGGKGQDVYVFSGAWGADRVADGETVQTGARLRFADRTADELVFERQGVDLVVRVADGADQVTVANQFAAPSTATGAIPPLPGVEEIHFADGEIWQTGDLLWAVGTGSDAGEVIAGSGREDLIEGGRGDDTLRGGDSGDVYFYRLGDGDDRIEDVRTNALLRSGDMLALDQLLPSDVTVSRDGDSDDIVLTLSDGARITLVGQADYGPISYGDFDLDRRIEAIVFNGLSWGWTDLQQAAIAAAASDGAEMVYGYGTPDRFDASAGDDTLRGLDGGDAYHFGIGSGRDVIDDGARFVNPPFSSLIGVDWRRADQVVFGEGIAPEDVSFDRDGPAPDLTIRIAGADDVLTVRGQFKGSKLDLFGLFDIAWFDRIEQFVFADGAVIDWRAVLADVTTGDDGDNALWGAYSRDTLDGKAGDDTLSGGDEGDLYLFDVGYGRDVIEDDQRNVLTQTPDTVRFGPGVSVADTVFARAGRSKDLTITLAGTDDRLTITDQYKVLETGVFLAQAFDQIERFEWADGSVKDWSALAQEIIDAAGGAGDDLIVGTHFDDTLAGRGGADTLEGESGSDLYLWGAGDGDDRVVDEWTNVLANTDDRIRFEGLATTDVSFSRAGTQGRDLVVTIDATGETLTVQDQFDYGVLPNVRTYEVETFAFADAVWSVADLRRAMLAREATAGDDLITGFHVGDRLAGGAGDDTLRGGDGSDVYVFAPGFGQDVIEESRAFVSYAEADRIEFAAGLDADALRLSRSGADLLIGFDDAPDQITVRGQFENASYLGAWSDIESIVFADGATLTSDAIAARLLAEAATPGDDLITGFFTADVLDGGAGDDTLRGSTGGDSYRFGLGSGRDRIEENVQDHLFLDGPDSVVFGAGVALSDAIFARIGDDMVITLAGGADALTIAGHYADAKNRVERFVFDDGTVLTALEATGEAIAAATTAGDDRILGGGGGDLLDGGAGDDTLLGGNGDDVYLFGVGSGRDRIEEIDTSPNGLDGQDAISFGAGLAPEDVRFRRSAEDPDDLVIEIIGTDDALTVVNQFNPRGNLTPFDVESFLFADGAQLTRADVRARALAEMATPGDDTVDGFRVADTIDGGAGDDLLRGSTGGDLYLFGPGSGQDRIEEGDRANNGLDGDDAIALSEGVARDDVAFTRRGADLVLTLSTGDSLTVLKHFTSSVHRIESVRFADDSALSRAEIDALAVAAQETPGDDTVLGSAGPDVVTAGPGDDLLRAEDGDDVYVFERGDGRDVIEESASNLGVAENDVLKLGAGVAPEDVSLSRDGDDLTLWLGGDDRVVIRDQFKPFSFYGSWSDVETIEFADGAVWSDRFVRAQLLDQAATDGDDHVKGFFTADTLAGGRGDDTLEGSTGGDLYLYDRGDGRDVIIENLDHHIFLDGDDVVRFGAGILREDVQFLRDDADLVFRFDGAPDDSLRLSKHFNASDNQYRKIERVEFADGATLDRDDLYALVLNGQATPGDDTVLGYAKPDRIDGYAGDDLLIGGAAGDTYVWGRGYGADRIEDQGFSSGDRVLFTADVAPEDLLVTGENNDLRLTLADAPGDSLTIVRQFGNNSNRIERFEFADGAVWTSSDLQTRVGLGSDAADLVTGLNGADTLRGFGGDDTLRADAGDDLLYGGDGADELRGQDGDDTVFGEADADLIVGWYGKDQLDGGAGDDTIEGGYGDDTLWGGAGDDRLLTGSFADLGYGGDGDDYFWGDLGADTLYGGDGADEIRGGGANDRLFGDDGADWLLGQGGADTLEGGAGDDSLSGGDGADMISAGDGDDTVDGGLGFDTLDGGAGEDLVDYAFSPYAGDFDLVAETGVFGSGVEPLRGFEHLIGTQAANRVDGSATANLLDGQAGDDALYGAGGDDTLRAGDGVDSLYGGAGDDVLTGGTGRDLFDGGPGNDTLDLDYTDIAVAVDLAADSIQFETGFVETLRGVENAIGTRGGDTLSGDAGANSLSGVAGDDRLSGGAGDDTLTGGIGADTLWGGDGDDRFDFSIGDGEDQIEDFAIGDDRIRVDGVSSFADLAIAEDANGAVIAFGTGDAIRLSGVSAGALSENEFIFGP